MKSRWVSLSVACVLIVPVARGYTAEDGFFDSNGVRIHYTIEGAGEPVLLIHGFSVNSQFQWGIPGIVKALAKDYRVICLDCRGHGRSDKPHDPAKYGMEMGEDAMRLLDHLGIRSAHLVGYSMGGFITLKLLALHPDRFLTATSGGAGTSGQIKPSFLDELAESLDRGDGIGPLLRLLTPPGQPQPTDLQLKGVNQMLGIFNDARALAAAVRGMKGLTLAASDLKANTVPTLALVGDSDPFKEGVDELQGRVPNLQVVVIKNADHMDAFLKPQFTRSLKEFLARNSANGRPKAADAALPVESSR
jgi:pimeloyl-ACP methyl ester carboxylesterase